ncbi:aminodeoxychorismate/anthranilate synthase component II [Staphylococcus croceilyticus]|uniref:Aminodeoxychorismate/anthranilate synthase component II n=1 Tax=Staphylococcus croceilyticus TaxID=319942 RepID=A0ABY2KCW2_9STAP|nr:aminodeoxychorismate/anthranilate synthase component II [Staphylococcus croceilyticus]PNZ67282.1 glutamine amidotransferase [Staphylococcus croceilyticus]TGA79473.1 aminodeoxychorismate/anthranilate synthase component II [Staphylococcus croceilyticus]
MILIIDNYDSFTYNLVDIVKQLDEVIVKYPDDKGVLDYGDQISGVIISPGPGHPLDNDCLIKAIDTYKHLPILGVCLGAQALTCYYGGKVVQGAKVMHGKVDTMKVCRPTLLYQDLPTEFKVMRYHSLISDEKSFPSNLTITGKTADSIQSFEDHHHLHFGIQYHPESFATDYGKQIITHFIHLVNERNNLDETIGTH